MDEERGAFANLISSSHGVPKDKDADYKVIAFDFFIPEFDCRSLILSFEIHLEIAQLPSCSELRLSDDSFSLDGSLQLPSC